MMRLWMSVGHNALVDDISLPASSILSRLLDACDHTGDICAECRRFFRIYYCATLRREMNLIYAAAIRASQQQHFLD